MAEISSKEQPNMKEIDLTTLSIPQLSSLKNQLDQEVMIFKDSLQTLKIAQGKFQESNECLDKFTPETKGKEILVPLTGSMYVPGKLADSERVLIDIGATYFANKNIKEAKEYFKRRIDYVTEQMEKIQAYAIDKSKVRAAVIDVLSMKLQVDAKETVQQKS